MGLIFGGVGSLIFLCGLYFMLNSLEVMQNGGVIRSTRRILGITVKQRILQRAEFVRFDKKKTSSTQSGSKHVVCYSISAVDRNGKKVIVGEGFAGASQADAAADFIARQFGLTPRRQEQDAGPEFDRYDVLTAD